MEPDDLIQHCFRCKGLAVIDKSSLEHLPRLLYRAASVLDEYEESPDLVVDLKAMAMLLDMIPDD